MFWAMDCNGLFASAVRDKIQAFLSRAITTVCDHAVLSRGF